MDSPDIAFPHLSSHLQPILDTAVNEYRKKTKINLLLHPLSAKFDECDSSNSVLTVFQQQVLGVDPPQSSDDDDVLTRWLYPTVKVIFTFSTTLREGVDLVCSMSWTRLRFTTISLAGILTCDGDLYRNRCPRFSAYLLHHFAQFIVMSTSLMMQRMPVTAKTLSSSFSSASNLSSGVSSSSPTCHLLL